MEQTADQSRRLESVVRLGTIAAVDHAAARVRVKSGGLDSNWLPWLAPRAGETREWNPPTVGEQCVVLSPSGETAAGIVLAGIFSSARPAPSSSPDEHLCVYPDGASIRYNHATGTLEIRGIKTALIQAADRVTIDCPESEFTGNVTINGTLTVFKDALFKAKATITGLLTYLSGMAGSGGGGGGTTITGPINHQGVFTNAGTVSSNGVVLATHTHPGDSGGSTGAPQ